MDKSLSRSQSVDERSVELGIDVDGDLVRERSVHGGSREASYRGGGANASASAAMDRSFRNGGGDRNRDRSVHSTSSAVPPSRPPPLPGSGASKGGKEANDDDGIKTMYRYEEGLTTISVRIEGLVQASVLQAQSTN